MRRSLIYFIKLFLYWLLFFILYRTIFVLCYPGRIPDGKFLESLLVFWYALRLDASAIAYLISFPLILWAVQQFVKKNLLNRINHYYNLAMIVAAALLCMADISLFEERNSLLDYSSLLLLTPAKIFPSLTTLELIGVFIGIAAIIAIFVMLFRVMMLMALPYSTSTLLRKLIVIPILYPVTFVVMRGGFGQTPISENDFRFSDVEFFNQASINPAWHLGHSVFQTKKEE